MYYISSSISIEFKGSTATVYDSDKKCIAVIEVKDRFDLKSDIITNDSLYLDIEVIGCNVDLFRIESINTILEINFVQCNIENIICYTPSCSFKNSESMKIKKNIPYTYIDNFVTLSNLKTLYQESSSSRFKNYIQYISL